MGIRHEPRAGGYRVKDHNPIVIIRIAEVPVAQSVGDGLASADLARGIISLSQGDGGWGAGAPSGTVEITPGVMSTFVAVVGGHFNGDLLARIRTKVKGIRGPGKNAPMSWIPRIDLATSRTGPRRGLGGIAIGSGLISQQAV